MDHDSPELIIVSNRLPVEVEHTQNGLQVHESPGGLASALHRLMTRRGGSWLGWPGIPGPVDMHQADQMPDLPYQLVPVHISEQEHEEYYQGFANEILWPLFHDLHPYCEFEPRFWEAYGTVNHRFAETARKTGHGSEALWIHDYHLFLAATHLRRLGDERPLGFFLHIPFPPKGALQRLPWHEQLLEALTAYDVIGVQTRRDLNNLREAFPRLLDDATVRTDGHRLVLEHHDRRTLAQSFPISTDIQKIEQSASQPTVTDRARELQQRLHGPDHTYIVGVERLDYTKGIPERLEAYRQALDRYPSLLENVTLLQHVNPSREQIDHYQQLRREVELAVARTNGAFGTLEWTPVRYSYGHLSFDEILSLYRLADIALVTPLRDGMNLVSKEYCAANTDDDGVLVLSKFAGAAEEFANHALLVNPHDIDDTADTIHQACTMHPRDRSARMHNLREILQDHDVHDWCNGFLEHLDPRTVPVQAGPRPSLPRDGPADDPQPPDETPP